MKTLLPTHKLFIYLLFVLFSFQLQAAEPQRKNLLIVGDSLSAAYGIDSDAAWVELLKDRLEQETLVAGMLPMPVSVVKQPTVVYADYRIYWKNMILPLSSLS